jgi:hypothetical protein
MSFFHLQFVIMVQGGLAVTNTLAYYYTLTLHTNAKATTLKVLFLGPWRKQLNQQIRFSPFFLLNI